MKIVHVCLCGPYNDGWNYQENALAYYHKQMGYEVTIITTPFVNDKESTGYIFYKSGEYHDNNNIKIIRKPLMFSNNSRISRRFRLYKGLEKSLEIEIPNIIFVHGLQFLDIRYIAKYARRNTNVKIYVDGHEDFSNSARNWISKNILHRVIWKYCAHVIEPYTIKFWGVLPARVKFLIEMYDLPKDKVELLVMGAEDEKVEEAQRKDIKQNLREQYGIKPTDFLIMTGGKIDMAKKQTLLLMKAVKELEQENLKLIVFGSVASGLKDEVNTLADGEKIQYIGWISADQCYKYFGAANLVVFPGRHSVFWEQVTGIGVPMVVKYWEGMTHIDLGGNVKFLYKDSIREIKEAIEGIINNNEIYETMKNIAVTKGMSKFSYRMIAQKSISE